MAVRLDQILVDSYHVASNGFEADVGSTVRVAIEMFCVFRRAVKPGERLASITVGELNPQPARVGERAKYSLVGRVAGEINTGFEGLWFLKLDAFVLVVHEAPAAYGRHRNSEPVFPLPAGGELIEVRGQLRVGDEYVISEAGDDAAALIEQEWLVERIEAIGGGRSLDHSIRLRADVEPPDYLIGLTQVGPQMQAGPITK